MLEFVVCDDNDYIRTVTEDIVYSVCKKYSIKSNIITFNDYDNTFKSFIKNNKKPVVYILDIEMPSDSGISMAKKIRILDKKSVIIFLTSHNELAFTIISDKLNILTFISKYQDYKKDLYNAIKLSMDYIEPNKHIVFNDGKTDYSLSVNDILYITKDDRKTLIVTSNREYSIYISMVKIQELLPASFVQSHRACIVNTNRIENFNIAQKKIIFDNGIEIDLVSDKYKKDLVLECEC